MLRDPRWELAQGRRVVWPDSSPDPNCYALFCICFEFRVPAPLAHTLSLTVERTCIATLNFQYEYAASAKIKKYYKITLLVSYLPLNVQMVKPEEQQLFKLTCRRSKSCCVSLLHVFAPPHIYV